MKTILIAWELGGGLGHVMRAAALARKFAKQGTRVVVCLQDLANCSLVNWPEDIFLLPAPQASRLPRGFADSASYGEILYACGYGDGSQLSALVTSWCHLMELLDPDIVIADHAPTAHLAARISEIPLVRIGSGFFAPPGGQPTPCFRTWQEIDEQRMRAAEARVLQTVNAVLNAGGVASANSLGGAIAPDLDLLIGWPELDCYASFRTPGPVKYIGNERIDGQGITPRWPASAGDGKKKILAYLKGGYSGLDKVLGSLQHDYATVAFVSDFDTARQHQLATDNLCFAPAPLDLVKAAETCDALICHAGAGSAPLFLEAGIPVLLLPYQAEQRSNADAIAATGAGLCLDENEVQNAFARHLEQFMSQTSYPLAARRLAQRWQGKAEAIASAVAELDRWMQARTSA